MISQRTPLACVRAFLIAAALAWMLASPGVASAKKPTPLELGTADPAYVNATGERQQDLFDETVASGSGVVRMNAFWFRIAPNPPKTDPNGPILPPNPVEDDPTDSRSPMYDFAALDKAVRNADARGLDIILTLQRAPNWALRGTPDPSSSTQKPGTFRPDPDKFADYATAVAERYNGTFRPGPSAKPLPDVDYFQAWNEGNLDAYLSPQYGPSGQLVGVEIFRDLVNAAYPAVKQANPGAKVVIGGSAPLESNREFGRVGPATWWPKLLCLDNRLKRVAGCTPVHFDIFDHHAITFRSPTKGGTKDGVKIADYSRLTEMLRAAEQQNTVLPAGIKRPLWSTEIYWESNPPDPKGLPPEKAADYLQQGLSLLNKQGVSLALNFWIIDTVVSDPGSLADIQGGLLFHDLERKPSFTAFRFPFVTERLNKKKVEAWGRAPSSGKLKVQQLLKPKKKKCNKGSKKAKKKCKKANKKAKAKWKTIKKVRVKADQTYTTTLKIKGKHTVRAKLGRDKSLEWSGK